MSVCELEVDAVAADVLNCLEIQSKNWFILFVCANPCLHFVVVTVTA